MWLIYENDYICSDFQFVCVFSFVSVSIEKNDLAHNLFHLVMHDMFEWNLNQEETAIWEYVFLNMRFMLNL